MPMDSKILQPEIKSAFKAAATAYGDEDSEAYLDTLASKLATAIIEHIASNAEVYSGVCAPGGAIVGGKIK